MYALMVLLFAGALWGLGLGALRHRRLGWIAYAACGAMLVYTHALGPLYVAVVAALFPLLAPDSGPGRSWRPWLLATAAVALSFLPWLPIFLERAREVASDFWVAPAGPEPPFFTTLQEFTVAPIPSLFSLADAWIGLPIGRRVLGRWVWFAPILGVALWILRRAWDAAPRATRALLAAYVLPIGMLASASLILRPILIPRVLLPTVIPIVLLLGAGADVLPTRRRANHAILTAVAAVLLLATLCFHARPAKEEWREMTWHLAARVQGTDLLLFDVDSWPLPAYLVARYDPSQRLGRLAHVSAARVAQSCRTDLERCLSGVFAAYPPGQRVWVVHAHERYLRGHEQVATWLHDRLDILETYPFAEIRLEYGRLRPPP
jgi:hypothetical protein